MAQGEEKFQLTNPALAAPAFGLTFFFPSSSSSSSSSSGGIPSWGFISRASSAWLQRAGGRLSTPPLPHPRSQARRKILLFLSGPHLHPPTNLCFIALPPSTLLLNLSDEGYLFTVHGLPPQQKKRDRVLIFILSIILGTRLLPAFNVLSDTTAIVKFLLPE